MKHCLKAEHEQLPILGLRPLYLIIFRHSLNYSYSTTLLLAHILQFKLIFYIVQFYEFKCKALRNIIRKNLISHHSKVENYHAQIYENFAKKLI